eukprot:7377253-Prymnesium_polylepis.1
MKDGMYHPSAYVLAHGLVQLPMMFALAAASLAPVFAIADWPWSAFPMHLVISATTLWAFEGAAQLFSLLPHPGIGLLTFIVTWFTGCPLRCTKARRTRHPHTGRGTRPSSDRSPRSG